MKTTLLWSLVVPATLVPLAACSPPDGTAPASCVYYPDGYFPEGCIEAGTPPTRDAGACYLHDCIDAGVAPPPVPEAGAGDGDGDAGVEAAAPPACDAGSLQVLADGQPYPGIMALDATAAYWFDFSAPYAAPTATLMSAPVDGGAPVALAFVSGAPRSMTVQTGVLYWTDIYSGTVMAIPTTGDTPSTLASGQNQPLGIAVDATSVYWTTSAGGTVMKVALGGGAPVVLADAQGQPGPLAVDAVSLYWANGTGEVMSLPLAGGTPVTLARAQSAVDIAVDATSVYWANYGTGGATGSLMSEPLAGGEATTLAYGLTDPEHIAVDASNLYVTTGDVEVASVPIGGGALTPIAVSTTCLAEDPFAIALGPTLVYWTNTLEGTVLDAPR